MPVTAAISDLRPGTAYHYRLVASNSNGTRHGADRTQMTSPRPSAHPVAPKTAARARLDRHPQRPGVQGACLAAPSMPSRSGRCRGTLTLTRKTRARIAHSRRARRKTVKLASAKFSIASRRRATVRLTLSRAGRRRLARARRHPRPVRATAAARANTGSPHRHHRLAGPAQVSTPVQAAR
jgi:hypothetical protein